MAKTTIHIFGLITSIKFYKSQHLGLKLSTKQAKITIITDVYFETEWEEFVSSQKRILCNQVWAFNDSVMTFINGLYLGGYEEYVNWYENHTKTMATYPEMFLHDSTLEMKRRINSKKHIFIYLYIKSPTIDGTLIFELYNDLLPQTCRNFVSLCTGDTSRSSTTMKLHYKNTVIHRVVPNGWIQGGDIIKGSGNRGRSIYGLTFPDESFAVSHDRFGVLGMANNGPHTNGSQFYVTLAPQLWMNGKMVAFGRLVGGREVLKGVEGVKVFNERPVGNVVVVDCGVYSVDDVQMGDLTEEDLVLYYSDGVEPPDVPVGIELPKEFSQCVEDVKNVQSK